MKSREITTIQVCIIFRLESLTTLYICVCLSYLTNKFKNIRVQSCTNKLNTAPYILRVFGGGDKLRQALWQMRKHVLNHSQKINLLEFTRPLAYFRR